MSFKEWMATRSTNWVFEWGARMEKAQSIGKFTKDSATQWTFRGVSAEFPENADRHQVFAYFLYLRDGGSEPFESLGKHLSAERLAEVWADDLIP